MWWRNSLILYLAYYFCFLKDLLIDLSLLVKNHILLWVEGHLLAFFIRLFLVRRFLIAVICRLLNLLSSKVYYLFDDRRCRSSSECLPYRDEVNLLIWGICTSCCQLILSWSAGSELQEERWPWEWWWEEKGYQDSWVLLIEFERQIT